MTDPDDELASVRSTSEIATFLRAIARAEPRPVAWMDVAPEPAPGEIVDAKYRLDALLGRGGMAAVYRATHLGTGRAVALKVLASALTASESAVERFKREAQAAGRIRHPNVVDVTDFGFAEREGRRFAYLVMELVRGRTLRALLDAEKRLPLHRVAQLLDQVCDAVSEAHALGVLHRDLKPENIQLEPDPRGHRVKVLDFGIAKVLGESPVRAAPEAFEPPTVDAALGATLPAPSTTADGVVTEVGVVVGTPRYMAPEQWLGLPVDPRTDVYALGVMAYEMLAGEPPFLGTGASIAVEHGSHPPPPLADRAPAVPRGVVAVIASALAKDPARRPPTPRAFAAALRAEMETTRGLLRRMLLLAIDHYGFFFRRGAIANIPAVGFALLGFLTASFGSGTSVAKSASLILLMCAGYAHALFLPAVSGLLVPEVSDLLSTGGTARAAPRTAEYRRALRDSLLSTHVMIVLVWTVTLAATVPRELLARTHLLDPAGVGTLIGSRVALCLLVAAVNVPFAVRGPAIVMEHLRGLEPLRRSASLMRSMRGASFGALLFCYGLVYGLFTVARWALHASGATWAAVGANGAGPAHVDGLIGDIVAVAVFPFMAAAPAILYVRAREAEGARFEAAIGP